MTALVDEVFEYVRRANKMHPVGFSYLCISRCTVQKTCIVLVLFTYVYHDARFRKRASCWLFSHMNITMHGSENVHRFGSVYLCISRCTVQKTCIVWVLLAYVYHDARFRKRASCWFFLHMNITMHGSENVHRVGSIYLRISRCTVQKTCIVWFYLRMHITMHGSENVHHVDCFYLCTSISRCTVQKTCIVWFLLTYVYHDARFRKRASFWIFLYMYITMHGSENVHHVGATCICISRCTVQKTCIMLDLLIYVHHDARFRKRKVSF